MANSKQVKKGGFPANGKQFLSRLWARIFRTVSSVRQRLINLISLKTNKKRKAKKVGKTQAEAFVQSRNATLQYAIDVLALAFILALIFTFINHLAK